MKEPQVLIVGAGPTGMVLALWLNRFGIPFRIIDKNAGPGQYSRAIIVHARILEFYRQIGISEAIVSAGLNEMQMAIRKNGKKIASIPLASIGEGLSPFPFLLALPQDVHEQILLSLLDQEGVSVEWQTELIGFSQNKAGVEVILKKQNIKQISQFQYVCGCDGTHSTVRHTLGTAFPGGAYQSLFYVADIVVKDSDIKGVEVCTNQEDFCIVLPLQQDQTLRVIGTVPAEHENKEKVSFEDVLPSVARNINIPIEKVNWFSTYHVHHRVADHFQEGHVFLLGDAAHIHSPAGGQGMNTGIGDAINLSWKLAAVLQQHASSMILNTYEIERRAFAQVLVKSTDQAFRIMANRGWVGKCWRRFLFPNVLPVLFKFKRFARLMFKLLSQIRIHYRMSPLSVGEKNKLHGGDRLPWVQYENTDNFEPLKSLSWQIHIYGEISENVHEELKSLDFPIHIFPLHPAKLKNLSENMIYFIRPDGHIAIMVPKNKITLIKEYVERWGIKLPAN